MPDVRHTFLDGAAAALDVLARPEVAARWQEPSALARLDVAGLAGHLSRSIVQVEALLDDDEPDGEAPVADAVDYYLGIEGLFDPDSPTNEAVRLRGAEMAVDGHAALLDRAGGTLDRLRQRLPAEPAGRRLLALGQPMLLDEYLRTRLVELAVHLDDLAVSADLDDADVPAAAADVAIDVMVRVAVGRIGTTPALRALARRERASKVLRAF